MTTMSIRAEKALEMLPLALAIIEEDRAERHERGISKIEKRGIRKISWWSGYKYVPCSREEADAAYSAGEDVFGDGRFFGSSKREDADKACDVKIKRLRELEGLANRSLTYGDGVLTLDPSDAKLLLPMEVMP